MTREEMIRYTVDRLMLLKDEHLRAIYRMVLRLV